MDSIYLKRLEVGKGEDWLGWRAKIPAIEFKRGWSVRVIPGLGGGMVRFLVERSGKRASVYLDCSERIGCGNGPYWEVYPYRGDVGMCGIEEKDELIAMISESLSSKENP